MKTIRIAAALAATLALVISCKKEVNAHNEYVDVSSVSLNESEIVLIKGDSELLKATVLPKKATDKSVTWNSSATSVASVDQDGLVTALNYGTAIISVVSNWDASKNAKCTVEVVQDPVPLTGFSLSPGELLLKAGDSNYFNPIFTPANTTERKLTWHSSNESIATVDEDGKITAISKGSVTITATSKGTHSLSATATVRVVEPFTKIEVVYPDQTHERYVKSNGGYYEMHVGENGIRIEARGYPIDCGDKISFLSSDPSILSVSEDGLVKPLKYSANLVAVYVGSQTGSVEEKTLRFKVWDKPSGVSLSITNSGVNLASGSGRPSEFIGVGCTQKFRVAVEPSTAKQAPLLQSWTGNLTCEMTGTGLSVTAKETAVPGTASSPTEAYVRIYAGRQEFKVDFKICKYDPYQPKPGDGLYVYGSSSTSLRAIDGGWRGNDVFENSISSTSTFSRAFAIIGHIGKEWINEDPDALTRDKRFRWPDIDGADDEYSRGIAIPINVSYVYRNGGGHNHSQGMPFSAAGVDLTTSDSKLGFTSLNDFKHTAYANANLLKKWNGAIIPFLYCDDTRSDWYFGSSDATQLNGHAFYDPDGTASSPWIMPTVADLFSIFVGRVPGLYEYEQRLGGDQSECVLMIVLNGSELQKESKNRISAFVRSVKLFRKYTLDYSHWLWCSQQYDANNGLLFMPMDNGQSQLKFESKTSASGNYVLPILYF